MNDRHLEELLAPLPENLARRFAKQSRIAIYGVGTMAWYMAKVLEQQQYRIIGFLDRDSVNIGKPFLDYTVIPLEAARDADAILIAAGQHYWEIIYRRIHDFCAQYGIPALYSDGSPAHLQNTDVEHPYWQVTLTQLEAASAGCEVISLDVFDTLLARKTSSPEDIFAIVASQASVCGYPGNFSLERKQAEALCQQKYGDIYTFADIYREWQKNFSVDDTWVARIQTLELETEARFLVPRKTLCNQVLQWLEAGRRVILVSDMYLPSPWILEQLRRHGLTGFEKLFLSCEEGGSKQSGQLWQRVRQYAGQATILHIGDNPEADIEQAKKAGIAAFHCMSEARMLQESALREIAAQATSLGDRIALGLIQDRLMNDPFCMAGSKGKPTLVHPEDFGYVVFGPLIQTFWTWFLDRIRADAIDKILFLARDGWFFHKLYQELRAVCPELPEGVYLPASRRLCLVATFFTAEDVFLSLNDPYFGRQDVFFRMRLGLEYQGNDPEKIIVFEEGRSLAEKHMPEILENARQERNAYVRYLSGVLPKKGKRCALYDFGVRGTIQKCLQKLCDRSFIGYYFYYDDADNNHSMKSHAVYLRSREDGFYEMEKINLLFEAIFTAPEGGYLYATEEGSFVTDDAYANYAHIADISRVHEGIRVFMAEHQASSGGGGAPPPPQPRRGGVGGIRRCQRELLWV
ncbi:MAG: HAD-IA family hydrolase [Zoogloeaceae bacterium]|jgi:FMN phosphatase YigB (HAD superfamily)|nr:HAD-IA family hydrolase [Zoogloeaceae bacterium]